MIKWGFYAAFVFQLLKTYFSDVEKLANELAKQIFYVCSRCLEAARGVDQGPMQLVTALRIIEREERFIFKSFF